jgi:hypothetical protein
MDMSLEQIQQKIKSFLLKIGNRVFIWVIILLSLINLILLGFLYIKYDFVDEIEFQINTEILQKMTKYYENDTKNDSKKGNIVASKNGSKFYYEHCSGVNRIKTENRIYYNTEKEAQNDGYELAANCYK